MTSTPIASISIQEIADRVIPTAPQISPNGRHITFTATTSARKKQ